MKNNNKIESIISKTIVSKWKEEAEFQIRNEKWLQYSSNIARRIYALLEDNDDMNQRKLAAKLGMSPQYISKILKGDTNLSLETIAILSEALGTELITFPSYKYSMSVAQSGTFFKVIKGNNAIAVKANSICSENNVEPVINVYDYAAA
jgi:transcriptional regulator with XRE-family HTH domain